MALFLDKGFEDTTVEDIAVAAGLSRRSYFRYFASKEDILREGLNEVGRSIATAVASRPDSESPWTALRRGFDSLIDRAETLPRTRNLGRLLGESPAVAASHESKLEHWQGAIAQAIEGRLPAGSDEPSLAAASIAAAGLGCFTVAQAQWHRADNRTSLAALTDQAMGAVHSLD